MVGTEVLALLPMSTNVQSLLDVLEEAEEADSETATIVSVGRSTLRGGRL